MHIIKKIKYILVYDMASLPDDTLFEHVLRRYVKDKVVMYDTKGDPTIKAPHVMAVEEDRILKQPLKITKPQFKPGTDAT